MLVVLFVIMSSKKNSRKRLCPGSKLAAPAHFGLLNKFCTRPGRKESEDGAETIDTAKVSPISAQCNPVQPTAELLQAVTDCSLTTQIGKILLERTALKDKITHLGKGSRESSRCNNQATTPGITLPSGNNE